MANVTNPIQVQKFLKGVNYPATRQDLVATARREGADRNVIETLERIPDRSYAKPTEVAKAIGQLT